MNSTNALGGAKVVAFVGTSRADHARAFYRDRLGLKLVSEDNFALVFDVNGTMLRATLVPHMTPAAFTVLGWQVPDIVATVLNLQEAGVALERYHGIPQDELSIWTAPGGARVAWFKDPDGNILSVTQF